MCMNSRILTKLERNHRNQAILLESRSLGPQRARQRVNFSIVSDGLRLNVYE